MHKCGRAQTSVRHNICLPITQSFARSRVDSKAAEIYSGHSKSLFLCTKLQMNKSILTRWNKSRAFLWLFLPFTVWPFTPQEMPRHITFSDGYCNAAMCLMSKYRRWFLPVNAQLYLHSISDSEKWKKLNLQSWHSKYQIKYLHWGLPS